MYIPAARALRAGRQETEAPGPALCRPVAIHERLGVGRAGSQPAPPSTNLGVTGHPGPAAEARLVMSKKLAHIYTRLDAAPGGSRSADPWPSVPGLAPGVPAASQHRPMSDGTCNIFEKKKKKKNCNFFEKKNNNNKFNLKKKSYAIYQRPALCGRAGSRPKRQGPRSPDPWPSGVGRAGSQPAPPSTNLGVTGHPGRAGG